ncbi:hypothetical protein HPB52_011179 [Rhipicephalus sanguineus]|uniref:Uncharacterized protein n=1 Tax=Rhipicephalus sanguineus TaxID=34632 RepID=A0A9D4T465_RHISA|nr:hypothetical protein HPB52_011179 [Rhipicephalus sanguineus]
MSNSEETRLRWYEPDCFRSDRGAYWTFGKARTRLENQRPYVSPLVRSWRALHTLNREPSAPIRQLAPGGTGPRADRLEVAPSGCSSGSYCVTACRVASRFAMSASLGLSAGVKASWRPTRFEDEFTVLRYACSVCDIIPSTTVVLPSSHVLFELCVTGCVVQDSGSICPLDTEPFCEDECQKLKPPVKTKHNLKAHC